MNGIYFSGTGNTKYCMEVLTKTTGGKAVSIEAPEALDVLRISDEIALGYPIYFRTCLYVLRKARFCYCDNGTFQWRRSRVCGTAASKMRSFRYGRPTHTHAGLHCRCKTVEKKAGRKYRAHFGGAKKDCTNGGRYKTGNIPKRRFIIFTQNCRFVRTAPMV